MQYERDKRERQAREQSKREKREQEVSEDDWSWESVESQKELSDDGEGRVFSSV